MDTSKIIKGVVNSGRYTVTAPIVKEDYGLYLQIDGVELPQTYEVDFSNSENSGTSVTMIGNSDGVLIPHQFIDSGKDIFAFLYHVGANYGRTVYKFRIPNKVRPDRTEETPTPEEQSTIDQAISALNEAVAQTAQDKADADVSAQNASADAERAEEARTDAQNYATQAQTYANNASASATSASQSATASANSASASAQSASEAETARQATTSLVAEAQGYANASEQSASASANSASQAQGFAQSASASANSASGYASQADISANTASTKAQDASGYAQTASNKATESAQSATNASQSAQTAEQAKTDAQTAQGLAESARDTAVQAKNDAESARDEAQNLVDGISGKVEQIDSNTERIESLEDDRYKPYPTDTASGAIASFPDGADDIPLKRLVVNIDPVQDTSSGDPSPENICPISGWTECNIQRDGKNLLALPVIRFSEGTATVENCFYLKQGTYTLSYSCADTHRFGVRMMDANGTIYTDYSDTPISGFTYNSSAKCYYAGANIASGNKAYTMTIKHGCYVRIVSNLTGGGFTNVQLEQGSSATAHGPYQGQTIPISWLTEAGTVYGGKLDVLSGVLRVYPEYDSYNGETLTGRWISDRDVYAVGTTPTIGAQVVNIGAEGTEYQLSPTEVKSLLGQNNIFADTGDTACEYRADTELWVQRKITEAVAAVLNS